jgi:hypothetical protein
MTQESYLAYDIPIGEKKLPFALDNQELLTEADTSELLFALLERGLEKTTPRAKWWRKPRAAALVVSNERTQLGLPHSSMTTSRFFVDEGYRVQETKQLLLTSAHHAKEEWLSGDMERARKILNMMWENFRDQCVQSPQYLLPAGGLAIDDDDVSAIREIRRHLANLTAGMQQIPELLKLLEGSLDLALINRSNPDFAYLFPHLKAKLMHASLQGPIS